MAERKDKVIEQINVDEAFYYCCLWPHVTGLPIRIWAPDNGAENGDLRVPGRAHSRSLAK